MNKTELVAAVIEATGVSKKDAAAVIDATFDSIKDAMVKGDKVQLIGFGNFEVKRVDARSGRNPRTGEEITIEAYNKPTFTASKVLKESVN